MPRLEDPDEARDAIGRLLESLANDTGVGCALFDGDLRFVFINPALAAINQLPVEAHLGRTLQEAAAFVAADVAPMIRGVLATGDPVIGARIEDGARSWRASYHPIEQGGVRYVGAVVEETTGQAEAERTAAVRAAQQAAVADLGRLALAGGTMDDLYAATADALADTLAVPFSAITERLEDGNLRFRAARGWDDVEGPAGVIGVEAESGAAFTIGHGAPVVVTDYAAERRFLPSPRVAAAGVVCGVSTVIDLGGVVAGVIAVNDVRPRTFSADDVRFLEAVANVLAAAINAERARERLQQLAAARAELVVEALDAAEGERRRLSEELHDGPLQDLLFVLQELWSLSRARGGDDELERLAVRVRATADALRGGLVRLHPLVLQHGGLEAAVSDLAQERARLGRLTISVDVQPGLPDQHDELVVALVREALTNVVKHAEASRTHVEVLRDGELVRVTVEDDGRGFPPIDRSERSPKTIGLIACRRRVAAVGGAFTVRPGKPGTVVVAELPLR